MRGMTVSLMVAQSARFQADSMNTTMFSVLRANSSMASHCASSSAHFRYWSCHKHCSFLVVLGPAAAGRESW